MKIVINEKTQNMELTKEDGTLIDTCNYKNMIDDEYSFDDLNQDVEKFNKTLSSFDEFDSIKDLGPVLKVHNWD